ncbi:MAG: CRISPR-associated endonuclease Cas3'' [Nitrospirae bacterium]|nr:CRISPR-associated endonuclease Cas3'' [Nitrospirota bacterium]
MNESYFRYWGKANPDYPGKPKWHPLVYHCLDVAGVAAAWWEASHTIRKAFLNNNDSTADTAMAWMLFFVALHDYGKFDIRFQFRAREVWQSLYPDAGTYSSLPSYTECKNYFHGSGGLFWFRRDNLEMLGLQPEDSDGSLSFLDFPDESGSEKWQSWKTWIEAVTGHHGHIRRSEYTADASLPVVYDPRLAKVDRQARQDWLSALERTFLLPFGLSLNDSPPECSPLLAGYCSVSDWLGSRCEPDSFPYCQESLDINTYFERRRDNAHSVLELSGIVGKSRSYVGVSALLKSGQQPHSMQALIDDLPLKSGLTIIEAPTGSGKTEAALAYAWRLIAAGLADSIVFALPTQATANAMLGRLERIATLIFEDHPNVLLAHGSARFNDKFIALKHSAFKGHEDEDGWVQCSEWLAQSRKSAREQSGIP